MKCKVDESHKIESKDEEKVDNSKVINLGTNLRKLLNDNILLNARDTETVYIPKSNGSHQQYASTSPKYLNDNTPKDLLTTQEMSKILDLSFNATLVNDNF